MYEQERVAFKMSIKIQCMAVENQYVYVIYIWRIIIKLGGKMEGLNPKAPNTAVVSISVNVLPKFTLK